MLARATEAKMALSTALMLVRCWRDGTSLARIDTAVQNTKANLLDQLPLVETACRCPVHLVDLDRGRLHHTDLRLELRFKLLRVMRFFW